VPQGRHAGIGPAFDRGHERQPILVARKGGEAVDGKGRVVARGLAMAARFGRNAGHQRQVVEADQGLGGKALVAQSSQDIVQQH
jgi:hypothetical protein